MLNHEWLSVTTNGGPLVAIRWHKKGSIKTSQGGLLACAVKAEVPLTKGTRDGGATGRGDAFLLPQGRETASIWFLKQVT